MDYYSGAPEPEDYSFNNNGFKSTNNKKRILNLTLIGIALFIVILFVLFISNSKDSSPKYNTKDSDSSLSQLEVTGGVLSPKFSSDVIKYNIVADDKDISFSCTATSSKAKIEGCESITITGDEMSYNIKVTAENGDITRYYFTITK